MAKRERDNGTTRTVSNGDSGNYHSKGECKTPKAGVGLGWGWAGLFEGVLVFKGSMGSLLFWGGEM